MDTKIRYNIEVQNIPKHSELHAPRRPMQIQCQCYAQTLILFAVCLRKILWEFWRNNF